MTLILDSGALIALERDDRAMWRRFKAAAAKGSVPITHGGVVGQAWRGKGARQARLARALSAIDVRPLDDALGRAAGSLLASARKKDVIDAALVVLSDNEDQILTSDVDDIVILLSALGRDADVIPV